MKRTRFKQERVCSSQNYEVSKRIHIEYIKREHTKNFEVVSHIKYEIKGEILNVNPDILDDQFIELLLGIRTL